MSSSQERLHKLLARAGIGSRRQMEKWIEEGRVSVNGKVSTLGDTANEKDIVRVDGHVIESSKLFQRQIRVIGYHKPVGEVCTRDDPEGRRTVFDSLPELRSGRWIVIGRLDINTAGLLLFTTDGELANNLMHPSHEIEREYAVRVLGEVSDDILDNLRKGVELEDGPAHFDHIVKVADNASANQWYHVILREGRNREVRRLWESQELQVSRLSRVRFGNVVLPRSIRMGRFWDIEAAELKGLADLAGLKGLDLTQVNQRKRQQQNARKPNVRGSSVRKNPSKRFANKSSKTGSRSNQGETSNSVYPTTLKNKRTRKPTTGPKRRRD